MQLVLDTTNKEAKYAILSNDGLIISKQSLDNHENPIIAAIQKNLDEKQLAIKELKKIILISGPGSYTGLRVGFSIAKGLSSALDIPAYSIDHFELLKHTASNLSLPFKYLHCLVRARSDEFYSKLYDLSQEVWNSNIDLVNISLNVLDIQVNHTYICSDNIELGSTENNFISIEPFQCLLDLLILHKFVNLIDCKLPQYIKKANVTTTSIHYF